MTLEDLYNVVAFLGGCDEPLGWVKAQPPERTIKSMWYDCARGDWLAWMACEVGVDFFERWSNRPDWEPFANAFTYGAVSADLVRELVSFQEVTDGVAEIAALPAYAWWMEQKNA